MYKPALTVAVAATLVAACSGSSGDRSTMDLLKAGDAKICVAADVEETLRGLVIPKGKDAKGYNISFDTATLETFDKAVSKASCHVSMRITSDTDVELVPSTGIDFTVVPSAQNPTDFVVSAPVEPFKQQLASAIDNDALHQEQDREREADASRLAALVKPGWLLGRWVISNQGSDTCIDGPYYEFARGGRLSFGEATGTWKLVNLDLTIIGPGAALTGTVAEADATTFTSRDIKGDATSFRRCSREETTPVTDDDPNEPDTSGIDAANPTPPQP